MSRSGVKTECAAFGCHRWTRKLGAGWSYLCPGHWQMVPRRLRKLQKKSQRRAEASGPGKEQERAARLWRKCLDAANRNIGI